MLRRDAANERLQEINPAALWGEASEMELRLLAVRPEGADHQWRKIPPGELSIDPEADERLGWVTGWAGAS